MLFIFKFGFRLWHSCFSKLVFTLHFLKIGRISDLGTAMCHKTMIGVRKHSPYRKISLLQYNLVVAEVAL